MEQKEAYDRLREIILRNTKARFSESYVTGRDREVYVNVADPGRYIGTFAISIFPGNSSILIFHNSQVNSSYRGLGLGGTLHELRLAIAREFGARLAMCTVATGNEVQENILRKRAWKFSHEYDSHWRVWVRQMEVSS